MSLGIQFKIPKLLQQKTNGDNFIEVRGDTVLVCIADLIRRYPGLKGMILDEEDKILLKWVVYVNDRAAIPSSELSYPVKDGDVIAILPMVAGG